MTGRLTKPNAPVHRPDVTPPKPAASADESAEDGDVTEPVRVLRRYLQQASELAADISAMGTVVGAANSVGRYEVLHAALQIGLTTLTNALVTADMGVGDPVLEVLEIRHDRDVGTILRCSVPLPNAAVSAQLRLAGHRVIIGVAHAIATTDAYTIIAAPNPALERLVETLAKEVPFPLLAPAPSPTWLAIAGDLEANRQAPHSTRRSSARRAEHFAQLEVGRDRSMGRMVAALLTAQANEGDRAHPSAGKASFVVHRSGMRQLLSGMDLLPLTMALPAIQRTQEWDQACKRIERWRAGSSRDEHMGRDAPDDPVVLTIRRGGSTKRFRYEYAPEQLA